MDNDPITQPSTITPTMPLTPDTANEVVVPNENTPIPTKKSHSLFWIILGLIISVILIGIGTLIWKKTSSDSAQSSIINTPDLTVNAPVPTPTGITTVIPQEILFESKPYRNILAGFEIQIPSGWAVDAGGRSGAVVVMSDPKVTMVSDNAITTFISISTGQSVDTLENEVKTIKNNLVKAFDSYIIEKDEQMLLSGNTYHLLGGSYIIQGTKMRNKNLILIHNNKGFVISATAPESVWSKKEALLTAALFSFKNI